MQYIRSTIRSNETNGVEKNNRGFHYIGTNSPNIERLIKLFKYGFVSDNIDHAKSELKRCLLGEKKNIPEVIFCESQVGFDAIKDFCLFLQNYEPLTSIPLILDGSDICEMELSLHRKYKLADEITFIRMTDKKSLYRKIQFLKKVKLKEHDLQNESGFRKGLQSINARLQPLNLHFTLKRSFDILVSLIGLFLLAPLFILIALAIKIESKGPVFYISKRAGRGYRIFNFYKFRTMSIGADKLINKYVHLNRYGATEPSAPSFFKIDNDPRITRVGSFLRKTSLDELPQFINVLLGDMSLVGNRPLPLYEAATLTTDECAKRFLAPAGMTGLWQIKKRGKKEVSMEERINLDIDYANNYSFMYDLWIMASTPSALIQKSNY
jgi:lipopolysaccharide/colanic/teichoic acid biosynthesis glycosyltransferase